MPKIHERREWSLTLLSFGGMDTPRLVIFIRKNRSENTTIIPQNQSVRRPIQPCFPEISDRFVVVVPLPSLSEKAAAGVRRLPIALHKALATIDGIDAPVSSSNRLTKSRQIA
ncbi:MAG: hypothetical protein IKO40_12700 [Kiritimatiellae bacterium]|nr:hypothetical protein [Kiritimatiellia bacterium]